MLTPSSVGAYNRAMSDSTKANRTCPPPAAGRLSLGTAGAMCVVLLAGGCSGRPQVPSGSSDRVPVPAPVNLLLPQSVHIHPFTRTRTFDAQGGIRGIEVLVAPQDAFGDPTKAFGDFRIELYEYTPQGPRNRGPLRARWEVSVLDPEANRVHWDSSLAYKFRLRWNQPLPVGKRYILAVTFDSPFTDRLFTEREFLAGE